MLHLLSEVPNESLPDSFSAQPSEVPFEQQPDPSPKPLPTPIVHDSIPEPTGENLGDHSSNDTSLSESPKEELLNETLGCYKGVCIQQGGRKQENHRSKDPCLMPIVSTDGSKVSTDEQVEGAVRNNNEGTEEKNEGTEEIFERQRIDGQTEFAEKLKSKKEEQLQ
ncbi:hypothetical protein Tco_0955944 [Tanacetum coccineum]|uniref:Uncharacterized protein n=1 Tax=Tanacetum coccineum TaxID=301880 RepID=A0ABQ5E8N5_9ASTR